MAQTDRSEVDALERADRLEQAATRANDLGLFADACRLWERACRYEDAAKAALAAGDPARAMELASRSGNAACEASAVAALAETPELAARTAEKLGDLGRPAAAGRLFLALAEPKRAAAEFERAAAWLDAARAHESAGDPRSAARCLDTAIDGDGSNSTARLALGSLLMRHGRAEPAIRALQQIPEAAPERAAALPILASALGSLGMSEAAREIESEMAKRGVAATPTTGPPASSEADDTVLFGRYRVTAQVARTPTARVFCAMDQLNGEQVAVKIFAASTLSGSGRDALKRFEREAVVLGQLRHPSIVPLRAFIPDGPAVVLAWMAGGSLADLLAGSTLSPARAVEIACAVLGALAEAHRRGILHRDIKPANVLFDSAGAVHLADFGTAHVSDAAATVTSGVIGTLAYMAPEQRSGRPANAKSDIYGVGALLWHALTGAPPGAQLGFLSDELGDRHREIAMRLVAPEQERPESALDARDLLRSVSWPSDAPPPRSKRSEPPPQAAHESARLTALEGARHHDSVLDRDVLVLEASGATLERALAFARADHPALAAVLRLDTETHCIWIDALAGAPLDRPLGPDERRELGEALDALNRAGGTHGAVNREHLVVVGGRVTLRFPLEVPDAPETSDRDALVALS
jgi:eukaryotic-like serine/threonine-protein kinase